MVNDREMIEWTRTNEKQRGKRMTTTMVKRWRLKTMRTRMQNQVRLLTSSLIKDIEFLTHLLHNQGAIPQAVKQPSARLLCTNLPQEVSDDVLSVLFQQCVVVPLPPLSHLSICVIDVIKFEDTKASKQLKSPNHQHPTLRGRELKWLKFCSTRQTWLL